MGSAQGWSSLSKTACFNAQSKRLGLGGASPLILAFTLIFRLGQLLCCLNVQYTPQQGTLKQSLDFGAVCFSQHFSIHESATG